MFTGIVEGLAEVVELRRATASARIVLDLKSLIDDVAIGDSVAVNGVCLTVVEIDGSRAAFDVISETLDLTSLGSLKTGSHVNVERSMPANGRFHGHVVSGHVDGYGQVSAKREEPGQTWFSVRCAPELTRQMIHKGSITIDGVSLTLTEVTKEGFSVALIPHTLKVTSLGTRKIGDRVNLEVDAIGKWVWRLLAPQAEGLSSDVLKRAGFGH